MSEPTNTSLLRKIIGLSPVIISVITLAVFIYQTNIMREQQHMTFYPHLKLSNKSSGQVNYKFALTNQGVGPAIIESIKVKYGNKSYANIVEYLKTQITIDDSIWIFNDDIYSGQLIPAGEVITLAGLHTSDYTSSLDLPPNTEEGANKLRSILNADDLVIEIVYRSIYEEEWLISNEILSPKKL